MRTLEVRHIDPRGPAFPGDLITSGPCMVHKGAMLYAHTNLAPFPLPSSPIPVLLYIDGKYAGFATLGPYGFLQETNDTPTPYISFD